MSQRHGPVMYTQCCSRHANRSGYEMLDDAKMNQQTWELMSRTGLAFFSSLVEHLATTLGVRAAFIVESMDMKGDRAVSLASWGMQGFRGEHVYDTKETPCGRLGNGASGIFPSNLADYFPDDDWLQQSGMQSYVAVPLVNQYEHVLGYMGVLDDREMENPGKIIDLLEAFVPRTREEIIRKRRDTGLQRILEDSNWLLYRATHPQFSPRLQPPADGAGFLGYAQDELAAYEDLRCRQLLEEDRPRVLQTLADAFERGQNFSIEYRLWDRQRETLHRFRDYGQIERDAAGRPVAIVGALVDITTQPSLAESHQSELDVLNRLGNLPGMTYRADRSFVFGFVGSGAHALTGYSTQALALGGGIDFNQLIHPEDRVRVANERTRTTQERPGFSLKYRITGADKGERRVLETGRTLFDGKGRISGYEGFILDQTKHYQALRKLHESEQHFRALFDNSNDGFLVANPETGKLLDCNRSICKMLGYSENELKQCSVSDLHTEEDLPWVMDEFRRLGSLQESESLDIPMKRKDGSLLYANISSFWVKHQGQDCLAGAFRDITSKKEAEQALRLEKEKLASYLDNTAVITLVLDDQGTVLLINRAGCDLLGRPMQEIIGENWFEQFIPARLRDKVKHVHDRIAAGKVEPIAVFENYIIDAQGKEHLIRWHNSLLRNKEGNVVATLSSGEDISDEREAARALESARKRLRFVVSNVPAIIFICEPEEPYAVSFITDNVTDQLGYRPEQLLGHSGFWHELVHPDSLEGVAGTVAGFFQQGHIQAELRIRLNSGGYRWYQTHMTLIRDRKGRPVEIIGYLMDIHRTKEAELALQERGARLAHAQKLSHVGSWEQDLVNGTEYWSDEVFRIFGFAPQAFTPSEAHKLEAVHPDDRARYQSQMRLGLANKEHFGFEFRVRRSNEEVRYVRALHEVTRDRKGKAISLLGTLQDVTERRQAEAQLRRSHEELHRLADHLQSARERERISVAREIHDEMAQSLTAQKIDLVRLKSKLPQDDPYLVKLSEEILQSVDRTIDSVQRVLTELRPALLDDLGLVAAIEWQVNEFQRRTEMHCHLELPAEEPDLTHEERTALFRIMQESLSNVLRHSNADQIWVRLKADGSWLSMNIIDNGKGISDLDVLDGRSFGLMGMRERAHIFGGSVNIEGKAGKGTTVSVRIPLNGRRDKVN